MNNTAAIAQASPTAGDRSTSTLVVCRTCEMALPEDEFYLRARHSDQRRTECKNCKRARSRRNTAAYYRANRAELQTLSRERMRLKRATLKIPG